MAGALVRDAAPADAGAISAIYNAYVPTTTVAWTDAVESVDDRRGWMERQTELGRPGLVATIDDAVGGFAPSGAFRDSAKWPGYRFTCEHTVYVAEAQWNSGIGRLLMEELL